MGNSEIRIDRFTFFYSFKRSIEYMGTPEKELQAYKLITDYAFFGIEPDPHDTQPDLLSWFEGIRPNVDSSIQNISNGKKGGRPLKTKTEKEIQKTPLLTGVKTNRNRIEIEKEIEEGREGGTGETEKKENEDPP